MRLARVAINQMDRAARKHALLLSCACFAILLCSFPATQSRWVSIGLTDDNSSRDETRLDAVLQQAATAALSDREGTIIIMDARTGRVRALVNPDGAYRQALMPGSAMKPFTARWAKSLALLYRDSDDQSTKRLLWSNDASAGSARGQRHPPDRASNASCL